MDRKASHILDMCFTIELYNPVQEGANIDLPVQF